MANGTDSGSTGSCQRYSFPWIVGLSCVVHALVFECLRLRLGHRICVHWWLLITVHTVTNNITAVLFPPPALYTRGMLFSNVRSHKSILCWVSVCVFFFMDLKDLEKKNSLFTTNFTTINKFIHRNSEILLCVCVWGVCVVWVQKNTKHALCTLVFSP